MTESPVEETTEEIERKWLINNSLCDEVLRFIPSKADQFHIMQWYLADGALSKHIDALRNDPTHTVLYVEQPGKDWVEPVPTWAYNVATTRAPGVVRVRSRKERHERTPTYFLTIKGKGSIKRPEFEVELPEPVFIALRDLQIQGQAVVKRRFIVHQPEGRKLEVDIFEEQHEGLILMEMEFPTQDEAESYELPSRLGHLEAEDVTEDPRYGNFSLAVNEPLTSD
jgi:CYTH domain-containing protein